jgi:hypothetical protein
VRDSKPALLAYHYFNYNDTAKNDLHGLLSSLLMQLSDRSLGCWGVLYRLYTACQDGAEQPSEAALVGCLESMLELPGRASIFIIVDALDECPGTTGTPSSRQTVLDFVKNLVRCRNPRLHICITSRAEQDIQATLNSLTSGPRRVFLHKEGGQRNDINNYIRSFVHSNEAMRRWRKQDQELVINSLTERAGGM